MFVCYLYWHWPLRGVFGWPSCQPLAGIMRCHALSPPWKCQHQLTCYKKDWGWDFPATPKAKCHLLSQPGSSVLSCILHIPDLHCSHLPHNCIGILIQVFFSGTGSASLISLFFVVVIFLLYLSIHFSALSLPFTKVTGLTGWAVSRCESVLALGWPTVSRLFAPFAQLS